MSDRRLSQVASSLAVTAVGSIFNEGNYKVGINQSKLINEAHLEPVMSNQCTHKKLAQIIEMQH